MTFAYDETDVHSRFDIGRALSPDATNALMEWLAQHVPPPVRLVVDLGCGTGRFTVALYKTFDTPVVGVEPAANMRFTAEAKFHPAAVRFVHGSASDIPLKDGSTGLVFMSQVLHHLVEREGALREIRRVLTPGGRFCLRQTTKENLDSYFYQRFFPEAPVDERRLLSRDELLNLFGSCGYSVTAVKTMRYEIAATAQSTWRKSPRAYSDLECIPEESFRRGLDALRSYSRSFPDFPRLAENDVYIFAA